MKKIWKVWTFLAVSSVGLILAGCADETVVHQKANLIVTNYSSIECQNITIMHAGSVVASTDKKIGDAQLCYFNLNTEEANYEFEVEVEFDGEHYNECFVEDFSKQDEVVLIGVNYNAGLCEIFID